MRRIGIRPFVCTALFTIAAAAPAFAGHPYDGQWSVTVVTKNGSCEPSTSSLLTITDGRVSAPLAGVPVVHARGLPRVMDDRAWLLNHVAQLSDLHEAAQPAPWRVDDAPPEFIDGMLKAIVGIEIPITKIVGKWKTSQNRPAPDKRGVIAGLSAHADDDAQDMAALVRRHTV